MTRDEALKIARCGYGNLGGFSDHPKAFVDMAVALGMLKLEEPKSAWTKFNEIVNDWVDPVEQGKFFSDMEKAGLKIVEK